VDPAAGAEPGADGRIPLPEGGLMNRRTFLRGAGGVAIGLPFLEIMNPRHARAALAPKRFVVFNTSSGTIPNAWLPPSGGETDFTLGRILSPLQPFRDKLVLLDGLDNKAAQAGPGNAH